MGVSNWPRLCKNAFPDYDQYDMAEAFERRILLIVVRFDQICAFTQPPPIAVRPYRLRSSTWGLICAHAKKPGRITA
jgi:hypothetical protein